MHRPVAAPFLGSLPAEELTDIRLVRLLDLSFGGLAVLFAGAVWAGAYTLSSEPDLPSVMKASCLMLIAPSLVGLWLMRQAERAPRLIMASIYDAVFRRLAQTGPVAVPAPPVGESYRGLAGVLGDLAMLSRRLRTGRDRDMATAGESARLLSAGREQARSLAARITEDAVSLAEVAASVDLTNARVAGEVAAVRHAFEMSDGAVNRATDAVASVAVSVRATTASAERMTMLAARLSRVAHDAQKTVADTEDHAARLSVATDQIDRGLQLARALGNSAQAEAARAGPDRCNYENIATDLHDLASSMKTALDEGLAVLREMAVETGQASRRVAEISELVQSHHDIGEKIGEAVQQQGEDVRRILQELYEARTGFATLRAGVDAVAQVGADRSGTAEILRHTAQRLPTHAETMASILRGIPEFRPPSPL